MKGEGVGTGANEHDELFMPGHRGLLFVQTTNHDYYALIRAYLVAAFRDITTPPFDRVTPGHIACVHGPPQHGEVNRWRIAVIEPGTFAHLGPERRRHVAPSFSGRVTFQIAPDQPGMGTVPRRIEVTPTMWIRQGLLQAAMESGSRPAKEKIQEICVRWARVLEVGLDEGKGRWSDWILTICPCCATMKGDMDEYMERWCDRSRSQG